MVLEFVILDRTESLLVLPCFEDFTACGSEIAAALGGAGQYHCDDGTSYSYKSSFAAGVRSDNTFLSAALVVECKVRKNVKVWEVVWVDTVADAKGKGCGTFLLDGLRAAAARQGVVALLVESSNRALTYWLTRPYPVARTLLRDDRRADLRKLKMSCVAAEEARNSVIVRELLVEPATSAPPSTKLKKRFKGKKHARGGARVSRPVFEAVSVPPPELECLYTDRISRDKRGRVTASTVFRGLPYRYGVNEATHVIFPTTPTFIELLRRKGLLAEVGTARAARVRQHCHEAVAPHEAARATVDTAVAGVFAVVATKAAARATVDIAVAGAFAAVVAKAATAVLAAEQTASLSKETATKKDDESTGGSESEAEPQAEPSPCAGTRTLNCNNIFAVLPSTPAELELDSAPCPRPRSASLGG